MAPLYKPLRTPYTSPSSTMSLVLFLLHYNMIDHVWWNLCLPLSRRFNDCSLLPLSHDCQGVYYCIIVLYITPVVLTTLTLQANFNQWESRICDIWPITGQETVSSNTPAAQCSDGIRNCGNSDFCLCCQWEFFFVTDKWAYSN